MSQKSNLHTHTQFCDGANTAEEMVLAAIDQGLDTLGFSSHSYTPFDPGYCMKIREYPLYAKEILALREKYKGQIRILLGMEIDLFSELPKNIELDYTIGSVHYTCRDGGYIPMDGKAEILVSAANNLYGGDIYALVEDYYSLLATVPEKTGCTILGHFDLLTKFQDTTPIFDTSHPRYIAAWKSAADKLIEADPIFEINTGAIARADRKFPYPALDIIKYLAARGARFTLTSDCHNAENMTVWYDEARRLIADLSLKIAEI